MLNLIEQLLILIFFNNKIEECINNRKAEILKMQGKEEVILTEDEGFDPQNEMSKLPNDIYLESTVLPLLHNALTMCEKLRPDDPIGYIAHFMLSNKDTVKKISDIAKELPKKEEENVELNDEK